MGSNRLKNVAHNMDYQIHNLWYLKTIFVFSSFFEALTGSLFPENPIIFHIKTELLLRLNQPVN